MPARTAYLQVSVVLPPGLMEGLLDNYKGHNINGKRPTFAGIALYALEELHHDLGHIEGLAKAGITLPEHNPSYTISIPKSERRAEHGFYSMKIPEDFLDLWWELLKAHDNNGPAVVYRALLSLYRANYSFHAEHKPESDFTSKYPKL